MAQSETISGTSTPEITDLTACRAVFAAWVFAYHVDLHAQFSHWLGPFRPAVTHGYLGVDGFFVLSGLILTRVHPELKKSFGAARRFWLKRLARIYPVHLAVIAILAVFVFIGAAMGAAPRDPARFGILGLVENLLLIQGLGFGNPWTWNYPSWTISTEAVGYLLFPWLARTAQRIGTEIFTQVALVCIPILGILEVESGHALNIATTWPLIRFFTEFIIGIALARLARPVADFAPTKVLLVFGTLLIVIGIVSQGDIVVVLGLATMMFVMTAQFEGERRPLLRHLPWLRPLGLLSYAFYMSFATSELLLAQLFRRAHWDPAGHKLLYAAAMTGLTFAIALVLHVLVENPCRRFADRRLAADEAPAGPAAPRPGDNPVPGSSESSLAR